MGEEAIQYCRSYAMEAERRMGEMLAQTERAKGGGDQKSDHRLPPVTSDPTLSELGLTKRESAEAQMLAQTERAKGGNPNLPTSNIVLPVEPTLSDLGLCLKIEKFQLAKKRLDIFFDLCV